MIRSSLICILAFNMVAAIAAEVPGQAPTKNSTTKNSTTRDSTTRDSTTRGDFNQVFVKIIVPVTSRTPKQNGPIVESWIAEQLQQLGETEYFAVTDWVPVCDGLLADDIVDNDVWDGRLEGKHPYCPIGGDIPERENGRLLVHVGGFTPDGRQVNINLSDEVGNRAVRPVQLVAGKEEQPGEAEDRLPYVAVIIAPPHR